MKTWVKRAIFAVAYLVMLPLSILWWILNAFSQNDEVFASFSQLLSLLPGKTGSFLRAGFYRFAMPFCAPDARIGFLTLFSQRDTTIRSGVYIGPQCNIGRCTIEKDTLLGSGVHVMSGKKQHTFSDMSTPIREQGGQFEKVRIGENCWLGNGALIMANVGNNTIVAAGAVVIDDVPEGVIVAGNPAKIIKSRST